MSDNSNELEHSTIKVHLAKIETKLDLVLGEHDKRIGKLETAEGRRGSIYLMLSAIGISIGFVAKYLFAGMKS